MNSIFYDLTWINLDNYEFLKLADILIREDEILYEFFKLDFDDIIYNNFYEKNR